MMGRFPKRYVLQVAGMLCLLDWSGSLFAQVNLRPLIENEPYEQSAELYHLRRLPRDPLVHTSYAKGLQAIEDGNVAEGLETLQSVLDESSDFFFYEGMKISGSLVSRIETTLSEHRDDYERLYGVQAQQDLDQALAESRVDGLQKIVQRFALTNAGASALQRLAQAALDQGDQELAARLYERLARHGAVKETIPPLVQALTLYLLTGQRQAANGLLNEFQSQILASNLSNKELAAKTPDAFLSQLLNPDKANSQSLGLLHEWRSPFGGVNHVAQTGFAPAMSDDAWTVNLIDEWDFSLLPAELKQQLLSQTEQLADAIENKVRANSERVSFPAATPLIVNGMVIARGDGTIKAFDLKTGELLWPTEAFVETTFAYLNQDSYSPQQARDPVREEMRELFFAQRDWRDLTMSSISTDGENVYAISDCQLVGSVKQNLLIQNTTEHPLLPERRNLLTAYQLSTEGKVLWSIGHASAGLGGIDERDVFFLGAPLVVNDHLYVLGEERGQVQVFELDPASGTILWSLGLLNPEQDLLISDARRMAGLTPAYGAGLLICPTGEGVISAVDPVRRSVVWSHQYVNESQSFMNRLMMMRGMRPQHQTITETIREQLSDDRWFDSRCVVIGDYLVFTPPDHQSLICLNASTGEELWIQEHAADQSIHIGAATSQTILLISRSVINAIHVEDGTPAWENPVQLELPSGRGVRMGNQYLQPLVTGEIAVVDILNGRLLTKLPLASGEMAGNLVAAEGTLVSQTGTKLTGFRSSAAIEQELATLLGQNEKSPVGLAMRGEWRLQQGDVDAGVSDLRQSCQLEPKESVRRVLAWAMLDGLKHEFPRYVKLSDEIESYLGGNDQQLEFRKTYALGLQGSGQNLQALKHYLDLLELLPIEGAVQDLSSRWAVSDERWVMARISELFSQPDQADELSGGLSEWLLHLSKVDESLLLRFLKSAPGTWIDPQIVITSLQDAPLSQENCLSMQAVLLKHSESATVRSFALRQLVKLALEQKHGDVAELYLSQLLQQQATQPEGITTSQFVEQVRSANEWSETFLAVPQWPEHIEVDPNPGRLTSGERFPLPLVGPVTPELRGWTFMMDESGTNIEISDSHGRKLSRMPTGLAQLRNMTRGTMGSYTGRYVSTYGNLAVVVLADRFLLIDLLSDPKQPRLILKQTLILEQDDPYSSRGFVVPGQRPEAGLRTFVSRTPTETLAGNVGPLSPSLLCYGLGSHLIAIDPMTGVELWRRRDIVQGSEIFGDDGFVIVNPPGEKTLRIFSALDGKFVAEREIPEGILPSCIARHNADWGRYLPIRRIADRLEWKLYDPGTETMKWETDYEIDTQWSPVEGVDIAFLESNKHLTVHDGLTGEKSLELDLPMDFLPGSFSVLAYADQLVFVIGQRTKLQLSMRDFSSTSPMLSQPMDGMAIAVDRATKKVIWSQSLKNMSYPLYFPSQWPIMLFLNNHGQDLEVLLLNRKTGKIILEDAWFNDQSRLAWGVETQPMTIQLRLSRKVVQLNCTEPLGEPAKTGQPEIE